MSSPVIGDNHKGGTLHQGDNPDGCDCIWKGTYYHEDGTIISKFVNGHVKRQ